MEISWEKNAFINAWRLLDTLRERASERLSAKSVSSSGFVWDFQVKDSNLILIAIVALKDISKFRVIDRNIFLWAIKTESSSLITFW